MPPTPEDELLKNLDLINPVKRCPECNNLSLEFDQGKKRIHCPCGFERFMKK